MASSATGYCDGSGLLLSLGEKEEALKYLNLQIEELKGYDYNFLPEIRAAKRAYSQEEYRKKLISKFKYNPHFLYGSFYVE